MTVFLFILILGILVFVHEAGHFMVARWSGVAVEEFGFGFPPRIWGIRRGATIYSINWIPFGGFVRLQGEQQDEEHRTDSFVQAPFKKQAAIMVAGVVMNALLAWVLLSATLWFGTTIDVTQAPKNAQANITAIRTESVVNPDSAASKAGLHDADHVISVQGTVVKTTDDVIALVKQQNYPTVTVIVDRDGVEKTLTITPTASSDHPRYGFGVQTLATVKYPFWVAPWYGASATVDLARQTFIGFWGLLRDLVVRAKVSDDVTGPVGIAVLTGQVVQYGVIATLQFMAMLSISLAVVNILPLPALDGGRLLFCAIGGVRGRPMSTRVEGVIHTIGFYVLITAVILLSIRDVSHYKILDQVRTLFQ